MAQTKLYLKNKNGKKYKLIDMVNGYFEIAYPAPEMGKNMYAIEIVNISEVGKIKNGDNYELIQIIPKKIKEPVVV